MHTKSISGTITTTVTLGGGTYADRLTVTATGAVLQSSDGQAAIIAPAGLAHAKLTNLGTIAGGAGLTVEHMGTGGGGGAGVDFQAAGVILNHGAITGGVGGYGFYGGTGGAGIDLAGGMLSNAGTIAGGVGGISARYAGAGGAGVVLGGAASIANTGTITGGKGGYGGSRRIPGEHVAVAASAGMPDPDGGAAILQSGTGNILNSGLIAGGNAGYDPHVGPAYGHGVAGTGIEVTSGATITNLGSITGGSDTHYGNLGPSSDGGIGVDLAANATVINHGTISGGSGGSNGGFAAAGTGGIGVDLQAGGMLLNTGTIESGYGGFNTYYYYAAGIAVDFAAAGMLVNSGTIQGGYIGDAVTFEAGGTIHNAGTILGGKDTDAVHLVSGGTLTTTGTIVGGQGRITSEGSRGGVAIVAVSATIGNHGTIIGGAGSDALHDGDRGASGGAGITSSNGIVTNSGAISGGVGGDTKGPDSGLAGAGGVGVVLDGGSLTNAGAITGGAGGEARGLPDKSGVGGIGISMTGGTLTNTGTIAGGAGGAAVTGPDAVGGAGLFIDGGTVIDSGTIIGGAGGTQGDAIQFGNTEATLSITAKAIFSGDIAAIGLAHDTLTLAGTGAGTLSGLGTTVTGFHTIEADSNTHWTLVGTVSGGGTLSIGTGAVLILQGPATIAHVNFAQAGDALLRMQTTGELTSSIAGFGTGDVIDLRTIQANSLAYENGTLTLLDANHTVLDTLTFAGEYTQANFALKDDSGGGTGLNYVPTGQRPPPDFHPFSDPQHPLDRTDSATPALRNLENLHFPASLFYFAQPPHQASL